MTGIKKFAKEVLEQFNDLIEPIEVPAKTVLLQEGELAKYLYFIRKGCLRLCFNHNGKDITFQFFFEEESVASIESFRSNIPSKFSLESIEACSLWRVSKSDIQIIMDQNETFKKMMEEILVERLISYQTLFLSRIKNSPQERYLELIENQPDVIKRVPQHFIASYLGITPVSLSRIRNRR